MHAGSSTSEKFDCKTCFPINEISGLFVIIINKYNSQTGVTELMVVLERFSDHFFMFLFHILFIQFNSCLLFFMNYFIF